MSDPIADRLRAWLDHHHLIAGGPLPAERELAGILGCSRHQARLAVLELEAAGEVSSAVGRRRVVTGNRRGADRDWSRTVVLVAAPRDVPAPGSAPGDLLDLYPRVHRALVQDLSQRGLDLLTLPVGDTALDHACQVIMRRPAGIVLLFQAVRDPGGQAVLASARTAGIPVVICGDELTALEQTACGVDVVGFDHATVVAELVAFGAQRGWRAPLRISQWLPQRPRACWMDEQARGLREGCARYACHHRPPLAVQILPTPEQGSERDWHQARILAGYLAEHLSGDHPIDVIQASSDGLVPDLRAACLILGRDLPILGYDHWLDHHGNHARLHALSYRPLVTVAHEAEALAHCVGDLLLTPQPGLPRLRLAPLSVIRLQTTIDG